MRVLQILEGAYLGGCELYALKVAEFAKRAGAEVLVLLSEEGAHTVRPAYETSGVACEMIPSLAGSALKRRIGQVKRMASIYASIRRFKPDVIQVVASYQTQVPEVVQACLMSGRPTQVVFQLVDPLLGLPARHRSQFERFSASHLQLSFVSNSSQNALLGCLSAESLNYQVIENGTALRPLPSLEEKQKARQHLAETFQISRERRWFLTVANLYARKGYHSLIHALAALRETDSAFQALWVGGGKGEYEEIRAEVRKYGLEEVVTFCGPQPEVTAFYQAADAFVFPSLLEGFSFALLEAMSQGLPVIASDCLGNRDVVRDGENGRLIRAGNSIELWKALLEFTTDEGEFRDYGVQARKTAEQHEETQMLEKTWASLRKLAKSKSA